jgi:hypothetical protein
MNKARRKALEDLSSQLGGILAELEALRDEEQEYFDNMPESLQGGDKGSDAEQAIDSMSSALDSLEEAIGYVDEAAV